MVVVMMPVQAHCAGWWLGGGDEFQPNTVLDRSSPRDLHSALFECRPLVAKLVVVACGELCERVP